MSAGERGDLSAAASRLARDFAGLDIVGRLRALRAALDGRIVFTTSLGLEDQAILHAIAQAGFDSARDIDVVTLDTGRMFEESYALWRESEARYGRRIRAFYPERDALEALVAKQGVNGFYDSIEARHACCGVRKVEPLGRALAGAQGWITGLRGDASDNRAGMEAVTFDAARGLIKFSPLFDWTREQVADYAARENAPVNPLHAKGFLSIGCAPCTRAIMPGEPERAGRWWWEQDQSRECGLHVDENGRLTRTRADAQGGTPR